MGPPQRRPGSEHAEGGVARSGAIISDDGGHVVRVSYTVTRLGIGRISDAVIACVCLRRFG
jgi:hypothetical protein